MEDLRSIALRLWERTGRRPATPAELEEVLVFQFRWFKPSEGRTVIRALQEHGLLRPVPPGDHLELDPAYRSLPVPVAYRPPDEFRPPSRAPPLEERVLTALVRATGAPLGELTEELERCAQRAGVNRPVAGLLVARARGVELPDLAREAQDALTRGRLPDLPPLHPCQTT
jgi:hypothetical protein